MKGKLSLLQKTNYIFCSSCSQHNNNVKDNIMNEICSQTNNKFSENVVKSKLVCNLQIKIIPKFNGLPTLLLMFISYMLLVAVKWCYESLRRTYLEEQEGKEDYVENQSKRRRYRSRRQRVNFNLNYYN